MSRCETTLKCSGGARTIVIDWVMKKMAIAFQMLKKNLNKDYVKKGLTLDFEKDFKNQRPYWDAFVQYKSSEDSEQHKPKRM